MRSVGIFDALEAAERGNRAIRPGAPREQRAAIAVDMAGRLINMNASATRIVGRKLDQIKGLPIRDAIAAPDLRELVVEALLCAEPVSRQVVLADGRQVRVLAWAEELCDGDELVVGAVVVLTPSVTI